MGPLRPDDVDFSVDKILASYAGGLVTAGSQYLLIGYFEDDVMPLHYFYNCGLYDREDAALACYTEPNEEPDMLPFFLGGHDEQTLRRLLGAISTRTSVRVDVRAWTPPL